VVHASACAALVGQAIRRHGVFQKGECMKSARKTQLALLAVAVMGLSACAGMSTRDRNTVIGAGAGAIGGSILTGGSSIGTVGGAAVGGVIGNQVGKDKR
jgi:osmotically inducible lipoprotein OsmB